MGENDPMILLCVPSLGTRSQITACQPALPLLRVPAPPGSMQGGSCSALQRKLAPKSLGVLGVYAGGRRSPGILQGATLTRLIM